jgi:hypothetical protein
MVEVAPDLREHMGLIVRAAIEWGKFMPGVFIPDATADHNADFMINIERVPAGSDLPDSMGAPGWRIDIVSGQDRADRGDVIVNRDPGDETC